MVKKTKKECEINFSESISHEKCSICLNHGNRMSYSYGLSLQKSIVKILGKYQSFKKDLKIGMGENFFRSAKITDNMEKMFLSVFSFHAGNKNKILIKFLEKEMLRIYIS